MRILPITLGVALGVALLCVPAHAGTVVYDADLLGYWKLDETSGTTFADETGQASGTILNNVTLGATAQVGTGFAVVDDGQNTTSDDGIVAGAVSVQNSFSFGMWVKATSTHEIDPESTSGTGGTGGQHYAFGPGHGGESDGGVGLSIGTNGVSVYEHGSGYMPALLVHNATIGAGFNHVVVVYDNKTPKLYLNGALVRTGLTSLRANVFASNRFGSYVYGDLNGTMDEVFTVARVLDAASVTELFNDGAEVFFGTVLVPEPSASLLAIAAGLCGLRARRRR